ncbi:MAG: DUF308 domain-containing protein [Lachnospiraceae bacterium]|nr:DUF308 domain-containing protein [Lachnospiraceae bacterium]
MTARRIIAGIVGVLLILGGFYCIMTPGLTYFSLGFFIGFSMLADGIARTVNWFSMRETHKTSGWVLASGIISLVFGLIILSSIGMQISVDLFLAYLVAFWLVILGGMRIAHAIMFRNGAKEYGMEFISGKWWIGLLTGILLLLVGIVSVINPTALIFTIGFMIGFAILISGINMLSFAIAWMG